MANSLTTVDFHGQALLVTRIDGKPAVALRPVCDALGLDWQAQLRRIKRHPVLAKGVAVTAIPSQGGPQQTICLPLDMLNGWLFGVSAARVKPELRERLIQYQRECFDVLASHFGAGQSTSLPASAELQEQLQRLRAQLAAHGADYLARHPRAAQVLRYHAIEGLSHIEKARLMGWKTGDSWRAALKELAALGLLEYSPHEGRAAAGRAGMARLQAQGHAQNPSPARQAAQQQAAVRMRQARQRQRQLRLPVGDAPGTGGDNA